MAYEGDNDSKRAFLIAQGAQVRKFREAAGYSCEYVASVLNPATPSRDRISKLERGISGIDQYDYLRLMWFLRAEAGPDHPAVKLASQLLPPEALRGGG